MNPFELNPNTGEPLLRLPSPFENIILTTPRFENADAMAEILNEPAVYPFINAPHPHTKEDACHFTQRVRRTILDVWSEITSVGTGPDHLFGGIPVRSICEIQPNGTWVYLGDFGLTRDEAKEIQDPEIRAREMRINHGRLAGDPEIMWSVGFYLKTSHHGRGIMSAVFKAVLDEWAIPYMRVRCIKGVIRVDNLKSQRVFEKMGFVQIGDVPDAYKMPENKGGASFALRVWEWKASPQKSE